MKVGLIKNILKKFANMKKINCLYLIILTLLCLLTINCRTSSIKTPIQFGNKKETINNEMIDSLKYIFKNKYDITLEELNPLLSEVSKKKIDITDWRVKYGDNNIAGDIYLKYRLVILHGVKLEYITSEKARLDFFLGAVNTNDYEILDLLNFKDPALDWNSCYGETVLTTAVRQRNTRMVKYLLDRGINKNKREFADCYDDSQEQQNAYEIALDLGDQEIIDLLK